MVFKAWTFAVIILGVGYWFNAKLRYSPIYEITTRLDGKTVLITGGSSGIGKAAAVEFAKLGAHVIISSRNINKALEAKGDIINKSHNKHIEAYELDLENSDSVRKFGEAVIKNVEFIDILINNAGVLINPGLTTQGINKLFAINHLGHFLLTNLLMEKMKEQSKNNTRPVRIINLSSSAYILAGKFDLNVMIHHNSDGMYEDLVKYAHSKLANILFTSELHRKFNHKFGITTYSVHPGYVDTAILNPIQGWYDVILQNIVLPFLRTPFQGCQTILYCALDDKVVQHSGCYFEDLAFAELADFAKDNEAAQQLWEVSLNLTGIGN